MSMQTTQAGDLSIDRPIMPADDRVPAQWKPLFNNAEWEIHKIVVAGSYAFLGLALVIHILVHSWKAWGLN